MIPWKFPVVLPSRFAVSRSRGKATRILTFSLTFLFLSLLGCQKEEIQHYRVPKEDTGAETETKEGAPARLFGVIVPRGDRNWFFKLSGPATPVEASKDTFDRFMSTVRFKDQVDKPVSWTLPEGWKEEAGGSAFRYATLRFQSQDAPLELTVTFFQGEGGSLLANINRWRGQINLPMISEARLSEVTKTIDIDGNKATYVDMLGTAGAGGGGMKPPFANRQPRGEPTGAKPISFTAPDGWQEVPDRAGLGRTVFKIIDGDKFVEASITPLSGPGGGLLANVNRWRHDQLGLDRITEDQLQKDASAIEVGGKKATYVDLASPESPNRLRILGVSVIGADKSWFFKLMGPYELVGKQKSAFEGFLKTVRFTGGGE
jgi:hypothetical protein